METQKPNFKEKKILPYRTFITLTNDQALKLHQYCNDTGTTISSFVRLLLDDFFSKRGE